jgi:hypothetical protein
LGRCMEQETSRPQLCNGIVTTGLKSSEDSHYTVVCSIFDVVDPQYRENFLAYYWGRGFVEM